MEQKPLLSEEQIRRAELGLCKAIARGEVRPVFYNTQECVSFFAAGMKHSDDRIRELEEAIRASVKKADGNGMGDWKEFKMLREVLSKTVQP